MNIDSVVLGRKRDIAFALRVGGDKMWTTVHEVEAVAHEAPTGLGAPTLSSTALHNDVTISGSVHAGNAAVFRVTMDVPAGWVDLDSVFNGKGSTDGM